VIYVSWNYKTDSKIHILTIFGQYKYPLGQAFSELCKFLLHRGYTEMTYYNVLFQGISHTYVPWQLFRKINGLAIITKCESWCRVRYAIVHWRKPIWYAECLLPGSTVVYFKQRYDITIFSCKYSKEKTPKNAHWNTSLS
jgi:hypothetical protein